MRVGNIILFAKASTKAMEKAATTEIGASGTSNYSGSLETIDYNTKLQGAKKYKIYDEMRLSDGQVKTTLQFIKLPLIAATFEFEPENDDTAHVARFCEEALFNKLDWIEILKHILLYLDYGFSVLEKVWSSQIEVWTDKEDGKTYQVRFYKKLAPRLAPTINKWIMKEGELESIEQQAYKNDTFGKFPITVDKIVLFTFEREGDNYEGFSLLRSAYKHWAIKKNMELVSAMSQERWGMGIPVGDIPTGASPEDIKAFKTALKKIRSHESAYLTKPANFGFDIKYPTGRFPDVLPLINYHNQMISAVMLQQFTQLGTTEKGARSIGEVLQDPFYLALEATANYITEVITTSVIKPLVQHNFGEVGIPKFKCTGLTAEDLEVISSALARLADSKVGLITPTRETEEHLRKKMKLPDLPEETEMPATGQPAMPGQPAIKEMPGTTPGQTVPPATVSPKPPVGKKPPLGTEEGEYAFATRKLGFSRKPNAIEDKVLDFSQIIGDYERYPRLIFDTIRETQAEQIRQLTTVIGEAFGKGNFTGISRVQVSGKATLANQLRPILERGWIAGREQVKAELGRQGGRNFAQPPELSAAQVRKWLTAKAEALSEITSEGLKQDAIKEAFRRMAEVGITAEKFKIEIKSFLTSLEGMRDKTEAIKATNELIGAGRVFEAAIQKDQIDKTLYSALMDNNTCDPCEARDEEEVPENFSFPNSAECAGGDYCRCLGVYILKEEMV